MGEPSETPTDQDQETFPFGWELVQQFTTSEGLVQRLFFDHKALETRWVIGSGLVTDLPERFHCQAMHPHPLEDDDGRALPVGWSRHLVEDGLSCYSSEATMPLRLRQWWSPAGPQPILRVKMKIVELIDIHMPRLRNVPLKMHAWVRVAVEWCHALRLEWFIKEDRRTTDDTSLWDCCRILTEACDNGVTPLLTTHSVATRLAEARQALSRQDSFSVMAPVLADAVIVSLDKGSQICFTDELAQLLEDHYDVGSQHTMVNLQVTPVDPDWNPKGWHRGYTSIAVVTNVLLLEPLVCSYLLRALTGLPPPKGTLVLKSSTDTWLLRRVQCGLKNRTERMRLLLVVQVRGDDQFPMEPITEKPHVPKDGRSMGSELSGFENMCFLAFSNWLTRHWNVHGDGREKAMDSAPADLDNYSGKMMWKTIWQSTLDLKVGKLRMEKCYRENYSAFKAELQSDNCFGVTPASPDAQDVVSSTLWSRSRSLLEDTNKNPIAPSASHRADFNIMMQEALEEAKLYSEVLELHNTERALRAANISIEEAHSVGRITQLAYVFLPLTFVTGVFGMNITAFGGGASMLKFWITTWLVLLPAWGFGLWTARTQITESLERRGVIARLKTTLEDFRNGPSEMKASLSALVRAGVDEEKKRNAKSRAKSRVGEEEEA